MTTPAEASMQLQFKKDLELVIIKLQAMLIDKNCRYGDSALNPKPVFSNCSAVELINVRIDDKLSRIRNKMAGEDEDPEWDLLGYLILKRIAVMRKAATTPKQCHEPAPQGSGFPMPGLPPVAPMPELTPRSSKQIYGTDGEEHY